MMCGSRYGVYVLSLSIYLKHPSLYCYGFHIQGNIPYFNGNLMKMCLIFDIVLSRFWIVQKQFEIFGSATPITLRKSEPSFEEI